MQRTNSSMSSTARRRLTGACLAAGAVAFAGHANAAVYPTSNLLTKALAKHPLKPEAVRARGASAKL